jgi:Right handed beta helix region
MRRIALFALFAGLLVPLFASAPAHAQATRTWVSGVGDDANPCSRTAPCKTFAGAISKTAAAGEINCLDPGGFGGVTITKSITLNCSATLGSILVAGTPGVTVNALASDRIVLRGIQIQGVNSGTIGVRILAAGVVSIEDSVVTQFTQQGISDTRTTGGTKLFIRNSVVSHNTGTGIQIAATTNTAEIENTSSINNLFGMQVGSTSLAMIRRSVFSGNGTGIEADAFAGINIDNSAISNNTTGVQGANNIRLSNTDVTFNATGFSGTSVSYGNNRLQGNNTFGTTVGSAALQ